MGKWWDSFVGMLAPDHIGPRDDLSSLRQLPRLIDGAHAAAELCMLPSEWPDFAGWGNATRTHKRLTQLKVDGINAVALPGLMVGGREGGPLDCALHCRPGLDRLERVMGEPMVFFGEYSAHDGFNATLAEHAAGRGDGAFWLYDAIPHAAWLTGREYGVPIEQRLERLRAAFVRAETGLFVGCLDHWMLDGQETRAKLAEVVAAGFEGLVSKEPGSGYARGRDHRWLKVKPRFHAPCEVLDVAVKAGRLHRVIVRGPEPSGARPLTLTRGWTAEEAAVLMRAGRHIAMVEFELTVGSTRSVRGATFKALAS